MKELPPGEDFHDDESADVEAPDTRTCPSCRREIYAGAERCPRCGDYVLDEPPKRRRLPPWMIAGVILALAVLAVWALKR